MTAIPLANSLNTKLMVAFAATALIAVALASFLMERSTTANFESYFMDRQAMEQHMGSAVPSMQDMMGLEEGAFLADMRRSLWISGGLTAAAALGLAVFVARQITRPMRRLAAASADIAGGRLHVRIESPGSDETGQVGKAFNSMAEELQRQEELRRDLMADIAHELRTPLSVVRGNLETMMDGLLEPSPVQLQILHGQSISLARLIEDLRTLSLASADQLDLQRGPVDMSELARSVVSEMESSAQAGGIHLAVGTSEDVLSVAADAGRIGQVLRNLLENALRYTPQGGRVEVHVQAREQGVGVSVVDTGSGIAPRDLPYVFDRFYRADRSRSRATGGSGLGLAIVRQLVEAHGGQVWAESELGKGSTFYMYLPG